MRIVAICTVILIPLLALGDDAGMPPSILDVKKQHEAQFLKMAGVVSVGIGLDSDGNQAIVVGLDGSHPDTESSIPATLEGFPVVVQTIGSIQAQ
jgi:hypothetical protein